MKVYTMRPEDPYADDFLDIKVVNFTDPNREDLRNHIKSDSPDISHVWFEDETHPKLLTEILERIHKEQENNGQDT